MASTNILKRLLAVMFFATLILSCKQETQTINIEHRYSLDLPKTFRPTNELHEQASLQYQDAVKQLYVMVIDEPKEALAASLQATSLHTKYTNDLKGYSQLIIDGMDSSVSIKNMPPFKEIIINGLKARLLSFEGISSGEPVYWKLAFIEGNKRYYQIMVWTEAGKRKKHEAKMTAIINSFKDTDKTKN